MALPVNIDDLINHRKVEWARIEYKEGWNPERVLHTICAFANDIDNWGGGYVILGVAEKNGRPVFPVKGIDPSLDLVEGRNTGVPVIVHAMQDNGSPSPVFSSPETREWLSVVLPIHEAFGGVGPKSVAVQEIAGTEKSSLETLRADFLKKISALGLTRPTEDNILRLFDRYGFDNSFSRLAVMDCLSLERSGATTFMMKIRELGLVESAPEDGRGCYRFKG